MKDESLLFRERFSPYLAGAGIGVLSWITFGFMHQAIGVSTTFVRIVGLVESMFIPGHVENNPYLAKYIVENPPIEWQMFLVFGLLIGAAISAVLAGSYRIEYVPEPWKSRFGKSRTVRNIAAFIGGILVLFGARLAGGCTSGHGLSGGMQLSISGWVFFASFFATGVITAFILFGTEGRDNV